MIQREVLGGKLNQSFNRSSRSDTFMPALIEKFINDADFIATFTAIVKQPVIKVVEKELYKEPPVASKTQLSLARSTSASADTISDEEFKPTCSGRRQYDREDRRHRNNSEEWEDKPKKHQRSSSSCPQADGCLKTSTSKSSGQAHVPASKTSI